ncbi:DUF1572 family protein [Nubsella zeaxanthinifaciens]|uniref:DUF1572 family protein n=1 Tax=Nubsella zeaxanthinifaciens TaxID=392412 RepID=UPI003CFDFF5F
MISETLTTLFCRDLKKLKDELALYQNEENIWLIDKHISNSAGNLCLHLIGNLNTYIGAEFGRTGYIRNRPEEFAKKNVPRSELTNAITQTIFMIENTLPTLTETQIKGEYPIKVLEDHVTTEFFLVHLVMHLSYHLGQVNYHRRMLDC